MPFTASAPLTRSTPGPVTQRSSPAPSVLAPTSLRPDTTLTNISGSGVAATQGIGAEQQAQLERALSLHIGPLAKTLVRKEMARQTQWSELLQALARHIDKPDDRAKFLSASGKL